MKKRPKTLTIRTVEELFDKYNCKYYYINGIKTRYVVTDSGLIFSVTKSRIRRMTPVKQSHGYYLIHFHLDGKSYYLWHHRVIAELFVPNDDPDNKNQVNHIDGIKSHNYASNLEWTTPKENVGHAFRTNLRQCGEQSSNSKLSEKQVRRICEYLVRNELTLHEIADKVGVEYYLVFFIYKKKTWVEVSSEYNYDGYNKLTHSTCGKKLKAPIVEAICKDIVEGSLKIPEIAKKHSISTTTLYDIKQGRTWRKISKNYF